MPLNTESCNNLTYRTGMNSLEFHYTQDLYYIGKKTISGLK